MSEYKLIRIDSLNKSLFIEAWESAFSRKLDSKIYAWIFNENNIIYAFEFSGEIVAGYCLYPLACSWQGEKSEALLCNNVFVCPGHQGKHLFVKIGKAALLDASTNKYAAVAYGIPNALALPGHKRVGWGVQSSINFLEKAVSPKDFSVNNIWNYDFLESDHRKGIANCSEASALQRKFSIIKSEEFISWRYESRPGVKYWFGISIDKSTVQAYCICKYYPDNKVLHIMDIDGIDDEAVNSLLQDAECVPEDFNKINVWSSTAKKNVFVSSGYKYSNESNELILMDMKDLKAVYVNDNMNLCLGDNDVY